MGTGESIRNLAALTSSGLVLLAAGGFAMSKIDEHLIEPAAILAGEAPADGYTDSAVQSVKQPLLSLGAAGFNAIFETDAATTAGSGEHIGRAVGGGALLFLLGFGVVKAGSAINERFPLHG